MNILILYKCLGFPLRTTVNEHLYSFRRYSNARCYYYKLDHRVDSFNKAEPIPDYLNNIDFDLIIYHYGFASSRWAGREFLDLTLNQVRHFSKSKAVKALITQDEYKNSFELSHIINELNIQVVFTLATMEEALKIFDEVDHNKVKFHRVLTGYIDPKSIFRSRLRSLFIKRVIDVGYRARNLPQWLGRHGYMKSQISDVFKKACDKYSINNDISIKPEDTLFGNKWPKFLHKCKYMIGVEGGATVLDKYGEIWKKGSEYLKQNPNCSFEEIEQECFPGLDGKLKLINISPRHLECCVTKTCQVMLESTFNDILIGGKHYIAVKNDFSNLDEVMMQIKNDVNRKKIVNNAYKDIVLSGKYSYKTFVEFVTNKSAELAFKINKPKLTDLHLFIYNRFTDWLSWKIDYYFFIIKPRIPTKWYFITMATKYGKLIGLNKLKLLLNK
ncbi:MAG: hypothetical protein IPM51_02750 [Sphingobacteriaceae bacterium]|nr:hypothetical protein [Sphingobacteriaceae bacterium]